MGRWDDDDDGDDDGDDGDDDGDDGDDDGWVGKEFWQSLVSSIYG